MYDKKYLLGSVVNLATLCIGLVVGFAFGALRTTSVKAQMVPAPPIQQEEEVAPGISAGTAAFGTLLSGRFATDEISVKGFDPIKFDENLLNLLGSKPLMFNACHDETATGELPNRRPLQTRRRSILSA